MNNEDVITGEILDDGTIRTVTDPISGPNHDNANRFYRLMQELAGGLRQAEKRTNKTHTHTHTETATETHNH